MGQDLNNKIKVNMKKWIGKRQVIMFKNLGKRGKTGIYTRNEAISLSKNGVLLRHLMKKREWVSFKDIKHILISLGEFLVNDLGKGWRGVSHALLELYPHIFHGTCDNSKMNKLRDKTYHKPHSATPKLPT